jgi:hypothetical protein
MGFERNIIFLVVISLLTGCNQLSNFQMIPGVASLVAVTSGSPTPGPSNPPANLACDEGDTGGAYLPQTSTPNLVTVDASTTVRTICADFYGINDSPAYDTLWNDSATTAALKPLNLSVGREWGGSGVDWINFTNFPTNIQPWAPLPSAVWNTLKNHVSKMLWQTNSTTIGGNDPSGAPVAQMIHYFKDNQIPIQAIEIGNENDNNSAQDYLPIATYNQTFANQCRSAKSVDPAVSCMGPASTNEWFWWPTNGGTQSPDTLEKFLAASGNLGGNGLVDKISLHWYPGYNLNAMTSDFQSFWPLIRSTIKKYDTRNLPVYFTEISPTSGSVENAYMGSALQVTDMIKGLEWYGAGGIDYFTVHQVSGSNNWGILQSSSEASPNSPSASYYALYILRQMGSQVLNISQGQARSAISTYSTKRADSSIQMMVINKSGVTQTLNLAVTGKDLSGKTAHVYSLTPKNALVSDSIVLLNGHIMPDIANLPAPSLITINSSQLTATIPAYSIYMVDVAM